MESPYMATIGSETEQVSADPTNTVEYGGATFVKLTASTYDVELQNGNKLVIDSEKVINEVEDGVPTSIQGGYSVIDLEPDYSIYPRIDTFGSFYPQVENTTKQLYRLASGNLISYTTTTTPQVDTYMGDEIIYEDDTVEIYNIKTLTNNVVLSWSYALERYSICGIAIYKDRTTQACCANVRLDKSSWSKGANVTFFDI